MQICSAMDAELLTTAQAARLLGKSVGTINRWVNENRLSPAVTLPGETGARLFRRSDIDALLNGDAA